MTYPEYLRNFGPELLSGDVDQMLAENRPIDRITLTEYFRQAINYLKTEPGPNLDYRRERADGWLGWWTKFLSEKQDGDRGRIVPFNEIKNSMVAGQKYGDLFAGSFELHEGHRFAASHMANFVNPVILIEQDWYAESKPRRGPFLDLRARISAWAYFRSNIIVSVLPIKPPGVDDNIYYQSLFDQTGAGYCFASESDPLCEQKIKRGMDAPFLIIPALHIQSTTNNVQVLTPDINTDGYINTTDYVTKLMPNVTDKRMAELVGKLRQIEEERLTQI